MPHTHPNEPAPPDETRCQWRVGTPRCGYLLGNQLAALTDTVRDGTFTSAPRPRSASSAALPLRSCDEPRRAGGCRSCRDHRYCPGPRSLLQQLPEVSVPGHRMSGREPRADEASKSRREGHMASILESASHDPPGRSASPAKMRCTARRLGPHQNEDGCPDPEQQRHCQPSSKVKEGILTRRVPLQHRRGITLRDTQGRPGTTPGRVRVGLAGRTRGKDLGLCYTRQAPAAKLIRTTLGLRPKPRPSSEGPRSAERAAVVVGWGWGSWGGPSSIAHRRRTGNLPGPPGQAQGSRGEPGGPGRTPARQSCPIEEGPPHSGSVSGAS